MRQTAPEDRPARTVLTKKDAPLSALKAIDAALVRSGHLLDPVKRSLADSGLQPGRTIEVTQCPWCATPFDAGYQFCPRCGRQLGAIRLYRELIDRGIEECEVRALLVRAGYEPF